MIYSAIRDLLIFKFCRRRDRGAMQRVQIFSHSNIVVDSQQMMMKIIIKIHGDSHVIPSARRNCCGYSISSLNAI